MEKIKIMLKHNDMANFKGGRNIKEGLKTRIYLSST